MNIFFCNYEVNPESTSVALRWKVDFDDSDVFKSHELYINYNYRVNIRLEFIFFIFMNVIGTIYCKFYHNKKLSIHFPQEWNDNLLDLIKQYQCIDFNYIVMKNFTLPMYKFPEISSEKTYRNALFYGGGKDSLLSGLIQKKLYGASQLVLLRLVWDENEENLIKKKLAIRESLKEMEDLGVDSYLVDSNYHSIVASRNIGKLPNLALYPGLMLPLIDILQVTRISNGYDASEFYDIDNYRKKTRFLSARPQNLQRLSNITSTILNRSIYYRNYNYGVLPNIAFELLSKEFSNSWETLYMCERLSGKWCIKCRKCFTYALACLAYRMDSDFNLGYFFQKSLYVINLLTEISNNTKNGNLGEYISLFAAKVHFIPMLQILKLIDVKKAKDILDHPKYPDAFNNLLSIINYYSEVSGYEDYSYYWGKALIYELAYSQDPNSKFEKSELLSMFIEAEIGISFKSRIHGVNGSDLVTYNYLVDGDNHVN